MAPSDKKKRRQSTTFPDLAKKSNVKSETELHDYYMNKNYVPPEKKLLETVFEGKDSIVQITSSSRRGGGIESGEFVAGKHLAKRYIEDYKFWKQDDKIRNKRRKAKIQKQFKGRKKVKIGQSSIEDEQKLIELIQNCPVIDCVCVDQSRYEQSDLEETIENIYKIILLRSRTMLSNFSSNNLAVDQSSQVIERNRESVSNTSTQHQTLHNSSPDYSNIVPESFDTFTHDTNIFETNSPKKDIHSNIMNKTSLLEEVPLSKNSTFSQVKDIPREVQNSSCEQKNEEKVTDIEINEVDFVQPDFNPALILQSMEDVEKREEFLKALADEDLMFCDAPVLQKEPGSTSRKNNTRTSSRRSVRRSARLMPHHDRIGSVDVEEDIVEKTAKKKFTKKKNVDVLAKKMDNSSESAPTKSSIVSNKKRRIKAQILCVQNDGEDKENVPKIKGNESRKKKKARKRIPTFKFEMSDSTGQEEERESIQSDPLVQPIQINIDQSLNLSFKRNSTDISLPNSVRRSLTGEFVPQTEFTRINENMDQEVDNFPAVTRTPLRSIVCPNINIFSPDESLSEQNKMSLADHDKLCVAKKERRKSDRYSFSSDEEVFISGNLKSRVKPNKKMNQRICISSVSSVDSQFG